MKKEKKKGHGRYSGEPSVVLFSQFIWLLIDDHFEAAGQAVVVGKQFVGGDYLVVQFRMDTCRVHTGVRCCCENRTVLVGPSGRRDFLCCCKSEILGLFSN